MAQAPKVVTPFGLVFDKSSIPAPTPDAITSAETALKAFYKTNEAKFTEIKVLPQALKQYLNSQWSALQGDKKATFIYKFIVHPKSTPSKTSPPIYFFDC